MTKIDQKLIKSIQNGDLKSVIGNLKIGANPNCQYKDEFAISHIRYAPVVGTVNLSSFKGNQIFTRIKYHDAIVRVLIQKGANFNVIDKKGISVIDLANLHGEFGLEKYLSEVGAKYCFVRKNEIFNTISKIFEIVSLFVHSEISKIQIDDFSVILTINSDMKLKEVIDLLKIKLKIDKYEYINENNIFFVKNDNFYCDIRVSGESKGSKLNIKIEFSNFL